MLPYSWSVGNLPGCSMGVTYMQTSSCAAMPIEDKAEIFRCPNIPKQQLQRLHLLFAIPFHFKKANNKGLSLLNYMDFYNDCRSTSILSLPDLKSPPKTNSTITFHRVLAAGKSVILHSCLSWFTFSHSSPLMFTWTLHI